MIVLNQKITHTFQVTTDASKEDIFSWIGDGKRKQLWTDFLVPGTIDYKAINVSDTRIELVRMPTMFNPFRPYGRIIIEIEEIKNKRTNLKCQILPYDGMLPVALGLLIGFLILWTLSAFYFARSINMLLFVVPPWVMLGLVIYLGYRYTKSALKEYSKLLIKEITRAK
jgi:hypothetical protein